MPCQTLGTGHRHWSLPAHRRGTLGGMDAATELTWTYLQRVPRWWAGKDQWQTPRPRARGALTARGTRRESVPGGSVAASMPPHGPASGENRTRPFVAGFVEERNHRVVRFRGCCAETSHTDQLD
ncbi:hypothetical protein BJD12_11235 [Xanthomonas vesicatoria ATCC 35937]|nr:hypothetical protein BI313_14220 [Xanthomonas vesicatoria]APP75721.1 hypothetical protein BJD12_11235 [Xanthomonas vesicatoria ATCC 35937]